MSLLQLYHNTLEEILNQSSSRTPEATNERLFLNFEEEQIPIVQILHNEDALVIYNISSPENQYEFEGPYDPDAKWIVECELTPDGSDLSYSVSERYNALNIYEEAIPEILGEPLTDEYVQTASREGFVAYGKNLITYRGKILKLVERERIILGDLLYSINGTVELHDLCRAIGMEYGREDVEDAFSKIISPLNTKLEAELGYRPIENMEERHRWFLQLQ